MAGTLLHGLTRVGTWFHRELTAIWPVFLFFLVGFLLLLLVVKLALAQVSVEIIVLPKAIIGALLAAKAALVMDETPLARSLERCRPIVAIAVKTLVYGALGLLLGYMERTLDALRKIHNFDEAVLYVVDRVGLYRMLAWALGIGIVFGLYFTFAEINRRMGDAALSKLFFESPKTRRTKVSADGP